MDLRWLPSQHIYFEYLGDCGARLIGHEGFTTAPGFHTILAAYIPLRVSATMDFSRPLDPWSGPEYFQKFSSYSSPRLVPVWRSDLTIPASEAAWAGSLRPAGPAMGHRHGRTLIKHIVHHTYHEIEHLIAEAADDRGCFSRKVCQVTSAYQTWPSSGRVCMIRGIERELYQRALFGL